MKERIKTTRLSKAAREFNVGISTIVDFLSVKGHSVDTNPNTKLTPEIYELLIQEYQAEKHVKEESQKIGIELSSHESISIEDALDKKEDIQEETEAIPGDELLIKNVHSGFISPPKDIEVKKEIIPEIKEEPKTEDTATKEIEVKVEADVVVETEPTVEKDGVLKVYGKIDLDSLNQKTKPAKKTTAEKAQKAEEKSLAIETKSKKAEVEVQEKKNSEIEAKEKEKLKAIEIEEEKSKLQELSEKNAKSEAKEDSQSETKPKEELESKKIEETTTKTPEKKSTGNFIPTNYAKLSGPKILDKIILPEIKKPEKKPVASSKQDKIETKRKRKRIRKGPGTPQQNAVGQRRPQDANRKPGQRGQKATPYKPRVKPELTQEEIQKQIKDTLARLSGKGKSKASKHRRQKREEVSQKLQDQIQKEEQEKKIIKVTEFVTANELANMLDVAVNEIISTCMSLGLFVSINQRLDAETLVLVSEEFGFELEFVSVDVQEAIEEAEEIDDEADLVERSPIVTVMGHVDHGKTLLLDYIRKANVISGEAGGITQHIGAYEVTLDNGRNITFLDTPGHEAFTAMRARGAKVTDVAIIIVAADDNVMPQTKEAINHAQAAGVPIVIAINKIDKTGANPDKIREELSQMNVLVEEWGGKYQCQEISAKVGTNITELLDKVLLESEMLELKGNPKRLALGTVIESSLDKGRGYVAKLLVQNGTLKVGDYLLAGATSGKVKAMYNERNQIVDIAGPSAPILLLGLSGAPQAGDAFNVMKDERDAKNIANKRQQLQREQGIRTQKHITLDEIGRRLAIGDFKELNIIVKGDVDGSVEALADSLIKLSTEEVQVNVIHKSVGAVTESDVLLASASDAVIIGFQVRPSVSARKLAEHEQIDIRLYSIIYQAIEELKSAIEGMLAPEIEEKIVCNIEIREVFNITKVGTIAGCMVLDGKINRNTTVRVIRDGIVIHTGLLGSLKRFKDDVKEVQSGYECGLNIDKFNDIKISDIIEGYELIEIKRKLA